jgi:hypothetical protein
MARDAGWLWWQMSWLLRLAEIVCGEARCDEAEPLAREALSLAVETGSRHYMRYALAVLARIAALRGERARALSLWATVEATEEPPGRFGKFDRAEYAAAMPDGPLPAPLPLEDAVELALSR